MVLKERKLNYKFNEELEAYIFKLLDEGFKVFTSPDDTVKELTWAVISKNDKIGYVQVDYFGGLSFSTRHKPNSKCGTGYGLSGGEGIINPTLKRAYEAIHTDKPIWASQEERPIKYKDLNEFFQNELVLKYVEVLEVF